LPFCQAVLAGDNPVPFTLPIVEGKIKRIAGYVHALFLKAGDAKP